MPRGGRTSGTRPKGSGIPAGGAGWGGPARGASTNRYSADNPPDQKAAKRGKEMAAKLKELLSDHIGSVAETWLTIMLDPTQPAAARIAAAEKIAERVEGKVTQPADITSGGERIGYVITAPAEAEDADAWARQHQPS